MTADALQAVQTFCGIYAPYKIQLLNSTFSDFVPVIDSLCNGVYQSSSSSSIYAILGMSVPVVISLGYLVYHKVQSKCCPTTPAASPPNP